MKKPGRNDPCPCGSGKKFKKCCENKMIGKKFMATKLNEQALPANAVSKLTSLFQNKLSEKVDLKTRNITASSPQEQQIRKEDTTE